MSSEARSSIETLKSLLFKKSFHHRHIPSLTSTALQYTVCLLSLIHC